MIPITVKHQPKAVTTRWPRAACKRAVGYAEWVPERRDEMRVCVYLYVLTETYLNQLTGLGQHQSEAKIKQQM